MQLRQWMLPEIARRWLNDASHTSLPVLFHLFTIVRRTSSGSPCSRLRRRSHMWKTKDGFLAVQGDEQPRMLTENQMAEDNIFHSVGPAISPADFDDVEREIRQPLPNTFKQHYLRFNGGAPTNTEVPGDAVWEPTEVAMFYTIKHPLPGQDSRQKYSSIFRPCGQRKLFQTISCHLHGTRAATFSVSISAMGQSHTTRSTCGTRRLTRHKTTRKRLEPWRVHSRTSWKILNRIPTLTGDGLT